MLYWHFRQIQCIIAALFGARLTDPTTKMTSSFFANPFDSDWMNTIQAGRFLTYTDAARWGIGIRIGFLRAAFRHRWIIISGGQKLIYKRPVKIFRRFQITYQITGWDHKWMYVVHVFRQSGEEKCLVLSKLGFRSRGQLADPHVVFASVGYDERKIPPNWIVSQFAADLDVFKTASSELLG
jgi:acyl-CoA thioesterase FadM